MDTVRGGDFRDPGRIGRRRLGQHQLVGRLAEFDDESVEAGGSQNQQRSARAGVRDAKAVGDVAGQEHERARAARPGGLACTVPKLDATPATCRFALQQAR